MDWRDTPTMASSMSRSVVTNNRFFQEAEINYFAKQLQRAMLMCRGCRNVHGQAKRGKVIYCDPPNIPKAQTANVTTYSSTSFTKQDHKDLTGRAWKAVKTGVPVLISNYDLLNTRRMHCGTQRTYHDMKCNINCGRKSRGEVREVLALVALRVRKARAKRGTRQAR